MVGGRLPEEETLDGLYAFQWLDVVQSALSFIGIGYVQLGWPNGFPYLFQSTRLINIFNIVKSELAADLKRKSAKSGTG